MYEYRVPLSIQLTSSGPDSPRSACPARSASVNDVILAFSWAIAPPGCAAASAPPQQSTTHTREKPRPCMTVLWLELDICATPPWTGPDVTRPALRRGSGRRRAGLQDVEPGGPARAARAACATVS